MKSILTFVNQFQKRILTSIQFLRSFILKLASIVLVVFGFFIPVFSCVDADTIPSKVNEIVLPLGNYTDSV